jgi:DNA polymerase
MQDLGVTEAELQSADRFADILHEQGVEPEYKEGKNKPIPAFAKTDQFMKDLLEGEDELLANLAQARLGIKSTIQQTRAATLGWTTSRGTLPVYIRAYGAKTTRPSGGDGSNYLNMKKVDPDMPRDDTNLNLKGGICAPPGYLLAAIDASNIECRLLNEVAGQYDVVDKFRNGEDVYCTVASAFYGYPVNKKEHPNQRQLGKIIELQAGYGSGGEKIRATLRNKAKIFITEEEGVKARDAYRSTHPAVVALWKQGGRMLSRLAGGPPLQWGPVEIRDHRMWLPNGCPLIYDTIEYHRDADSGGEYWRIKTRRGWEKTYGAKLVENLIQALAWNLVSDAMVRINRLGFRTLNCPYDELLILIPKDGHEKQHLQQCKDEMCRVPPWLPNLPLACDGELSERYEK